MSEIVSKTKEQRAWEAEDNARTLIHAKAIMNNPQKLKAAKVAAKKIAVEELQKAKAAAQVAGTKNPIVKKKATPKRKPVTAKRKAVKAKGKRK